MKNSPLKLVQVLFTLNALIWTGLGIATLLRLDTTSPQLRIVMTIIGVMMFGNAGAMLLSAWGLGKKRKFFFFSALAVLVVNILLTFTDQVGLADWLTFFVDLILLVILTINWKFFTEKR